MLIILFLVSHFNVLFVPCGRLSWLPVSFLLHIKYSLSYRIISYMQHGQCSAVCCLLLFNTVSVDTSCSLCTSLFLDCCPVVTFYFIQWTLFHCYFIAFYYYKPLVTLCVSWLNWWLIDWYELSLWKSWHLFITLDVLNVDVVYLK